MRAADFDIPFNRAGLAGNEQAYVQQALAEGQISGDGPFTRRVEASLEESLGAGRVLLTTSCTHALELAALLLDVGPGDEVIVPAFTFVSTANAFALRGARIVFADVRRDTLNLDETQLEELVTPRTRAVVPVHYAGVACELDAILEVARSHDVAVVEDNAHGLFGRYRGRFLGTFGAFAAQSFHETKSFTCGEGGALVVNEPAHVERAEVIREKGTNRKRFFRGEIDRYTWVDIGSSYVISDLLAAFLLAQLEARDEVQAARERLWRRYAVDLADWAAESGAVLPFVPEHCEHAYHLFHVVLPSAAARAALIDHLRSQRILAVFHYLPLHLSDMGRRFGGRTGQCPVTEDVADRLVRLPLYGTLGPDEQARVIEAVRTAPLP
ncbi:MAG: dTDP-4-amino-4,6-dideoxygalactose transaminase [Gaiellaceae bacterium]